MNSKLLYAATIAISLISTLAMADNASSAPLTRAEVKAELDTAIKNGTLQRTDYDSYKQEANANTSRDQIRSELADSKLARKALKGPNADRTYNQYGTEILKTSILSRAEVKNDVREAAANGTLQRTDYDDAALVARRANAHAASAKFAQRVKAALSRNQG
jgi:Domain of unknown function (DUF4148)